MGGGGKRRLGWLCCSACRRAKRVVAGPLPCMRAANGNRARVPHLHGLLRLVRPVHLEVHLHAQRRPARGEGPDGRWGGCVKTRPAGRLEAPATATTPSYIPGARLHFKRGVAGVAALERLGVVALVRIDHARDQQQRRVAVARRVGQPLLEHSEHVILRNQDVRTGS